MVAFRKLSPALAVAALLLGSVSAYAQGTPLSCQANTGVAPTVRAEGLTELLGDLVLTCTGGNANLPFLANFQIFLNTNVTSRLTSGVYDALLLVDEPGVARAGLNGAAGVPTPFCVSPAPGSNTQVGSDLVASIPGSTSAGAAGTFCNNTAASGGTADQSFQQGTYTVFRGARPAVTSNSSVVWAGVPVIPPGTTGSRTFRFTNIRGNASTIGVSASGLPTQIVAFISVSPQGSISIDNANVVVGYPQQGLRFDTRTCGNGDRSSSNSTFFQCSSQNQDRFNTPGSGSLPSNTGSASSVIGLRFREGFQTAFKVRGFAAQSNTLPNQVYNSESGFVRTDVATNSASLGSAGIADTGTRLMARFNNVPAGVALFASVTNIPQSSSTGATAVLVNADVNGASFTNLGALPGLPTVINGPVTLNCAEITGFTGVAAVQVPMNAASTGGTTTTGTSGQAVWEVTAADQSNLDSLVFAVGVAYQANAGNNTPGLGATTVTGTFAPMFTDANSGTPADAPQPVIPRFTAGSATAQNLFSIAACSTNLLFPFVTNQAGFDTGIAISNTSDDPFNGANGQNRNNGNCTINYYGSLPNNQPLTTAKETTTTPLQYGQTLAMVLSTGGTNGLRGNAGMQGYIIAQCDFRFAHGFAFITDGPIGQARVAEGYLAIVLDGVNTIRGNVNGESQGN